MSIRRNPTTGGDPSQGLPPPPPYSMESSGDSRRQQPYAPPPGPPPSHYQSNPQINTNPFSTPSQGPNLMNVDPRTYVYPSSGSSRPSVGSPTQPGGQPGGSGQIRQRSIKENPLDLLKNYDTIFVIDDSSSMNVNELPDGSMGQSRWEEARDALAGMVALAARLDDDGVDIHFLNQERCLLSCRESQQVISLFDSIEPEGVTPMGTKISELLLQYLDDIEMYKSSKVGKAPKKRNYICLTDGSPTDDPESVIVAIAGRLDRGNFPLDQIGIQFIQIGNDHEATEYLQELDDALSSTHQVRDIVDTVTYSNMAVNPEMITKALLGGINRRLDRQKERR